MNTGNCYSVLIATPFWVIILGLLALALWPIVLLRDRREGLFYQTAYSALVGEGNMFVLVVMATEILKRGVLTPEWSQGWVYHLFATFCGTMVGVIWCILDYPKQWADRYHHWVIAPLLVYFLMTLWPVVWMFGTPIEKRAALALLVSQVILLIYDGRTGRLNSRKYHDLGSHLDRMKHLETHAW